HKFKNPSPSRRAFFLLTFFGKTMKVSQPRQGMKQGMNHPPQNQKEKQKNPTPFDAPFFSWITVSPPPTTQRATP
ncbi:hypothetical protein, partial [Ralstonia sp. TCR112]|uniref:hypothetical protein n=1 Tax=Ralstonia sp. TCR112 TaxID=2601730 RepID=UPI001C9B21CA